jgi:exodeoxyribonuclease-1
MAETFYWYDLETTGTNPKWDRIVQFAGQRTDQDLNPIGDALCFFVHLPDDVLPNPDAALVTGITPSKLAAQGISEFNALQRILNEFNVPGTCALGYNSLRFDDEFIRYALYRHLLDPYAREYRNGNSRWDLVDLVRAAGALRPKGIHWPTDELGQPVYKLEELTRANGIDHGQAHDAMSDVYATIGMAKLLKSEQPRLFDYYYDLRQKKYVKELLEPLGERLCVHVSAMYGKDRSNVAPVISITRHPNNTNAIVVADLGQDIECLLDWSEDEIRQKLFVPKGEARAPLREVKINRSPFVAPFEVLDDENIQTLGLSKKVIKERWRRLKQPAIAQKIRRAYVQDGMPRESDPDAALYGAFLQEEDKARSNHLYQEIAQGRWPDMDFRDGRLPALAARMKARSFPQLMTPDERSAWQDYVKDKLVGQGDWLNLARFAERLSELEAENLDADKRGILKELGEYGDALKAKYELV